jgi:hypothetical protein
MFREERHEPEEERLSGEERRKLNEYIALMAKKNSVGVEIVRGQDMRRIGELRRELGDERIEKHVTRDEVNGPIFP